MCIEQRGIFMIVNNERFVFQDKETSASVGTDMISEKCDHVTLYITGTATSSLVLFEGSDKDGNWYASPAIRLSDLSCSSQTTGINEAWTIDLSNWFSVRTNISSISGGYITITGRATNSGIM